MKLFTYFSSPYHYNHPTLTLLCPLCLCNYPKHLWVIDAIDTALPWMYLNLRECVSLARSPSSSPFFLQLPDQYRRGSTLAASSPRFIPSPSISHSLPGQLQIFQLGISDFWGSLLHFFFFFLPQLQVLSPRLGPHPRLFLEFCLGLLQVLQFNPLLNCCRNKWEHVLNWTLFYICFPCCFMGATTWRDWRHRGKGFYIYCLVFPQCWSLSQHVT